MKGVLMSRLPAAEPSIDAVRASGNAVVPISIPKGIDPAAFPSMVNAIEKALVVMAGTGVGAGVVERADRLAELATEWAEPDLALVDERIHRMRTIHEVFAEGDWLTAEQVNALQANPPANKAHPASDWKRRGRVFSVSYRGKEYFAGYQFDALYQPLPIIREILAAFGEVADTWTLAAWFHYPNAWLVRRDEHVASNVAPKDALDRGAEVVRAAAQRQGSYVA
jgi:hypothetical protein